MALDLGAEMHPRVQICTQIVEKRFEMSRNPFLRHRACCYRLLSKNLLLWMCENIGHQVQFALFVALRVSSNQARI